MDSCAARQSMLIVLAWLALPIAFHGQAGSRDADRLNVAKKVVQASGAEAVIINSIELTLPAQRSQNPSIPPEFWDRFAAKAKSDVGNLVDSLAPVYANRFSKTELEQLLAFYQSPVGRRVVNEQGLLAQESQQLGVRWGTRLGAAVAVEMAQEGKPLRQ